MRGLVLDRSSLFHGSPPPNLSQFPSPSPSLPSPFLPLVTSPFPSPIPLPRPSFRSRHLPSTVSCIPFLFSTARGDSVQSPFRLLQSLYTPAIALILTAPYHTSRVFFPHPH